MERRFLQDRTTTEPIRMSLPRFVMLATSIFLVMGFGALMAWQVTGRVECMRAFFHGPGAMYLVFLAALEFSLGRMVVRQFSEGEPLQPAWFLIMLSGGCQMVSAVCVQILGANSSLNPLAQGPLSSASLDPSAIHRFGLIVGGPLQMLLLVCGLGCMLRLCRRSGIAARFQASDWTLMSIAGFAAYLQISDLVTAADAGRALSTYDLLLAGNGPLLIVLLIEANLVKRYMGTLYGGMIAKCWSAFAAAIFLSTLGSVGAWLNMHGYLPPEVACVSSSIWFLSATAFTLGAAWQIEAIQSACGEVGVSRFSPIATSLAALRLLNPGRTQ
jgi:hypothetical protein